MSRITLDAESRKRLGDLFGDLTQATEVCDESGRVIAHYVPHAGNRRESPYSIEELNRIARETKRWHTSEEMFAMLRKLEAEHG